MVVSGGSIFDDSAIDEISISGPTKIASFGLPTWVGDQITPEVAGVGMHPLSALRGGDAVFNAGELHKLLMASADQTVAYRDSVLINSAGALIVAGEASSWNEGVARAAEAIDNGKARSLLDRWIEAVS